MSAKYGKWSLTPSISGGAKRRPLHAVVCARPGHDFMGGKPPVHFPGRRHFDTFKKYEPKARAEGRPDVDAIIGNFVLYGDVVGAEESVLWMLRPNAEFDLLCRCKGRVRQEVFQVSPHESCHCGLNFCR